MSASNKAYPVAWAEGTLLAPQHFQHMVRYQSAMHNSGFQSLQPWHWGFLQLKFQEEALLTGVVALAHCELRWRHGAWLTFDKRVCPPVQYTVPAEAGEYTLALCWSRIGRVDNLPGYEGPLPVTWRAAYLDMADQFDPLREREVGILYPQLEIKPMDADLSADYMLPLCRVLRPKKRAKCHFDERFVPPLLDIQQSASLSNMLGGLQQSLRHAISLYQAQSEQVRLQPLAGDEAGLFHHSVVTADAQLHHLLAQPNVHPYHAFLLAATLQAQLGALPASGQAVSYTHDQPYTCFAEVIHALEHRLAQHSQPEDPAIVLHAVEPGYYLSDALTAETWQQKQFYLAVRCAQPTVSSSNDVAIKLKVASAEQMPHLLASALPGLSLQPVAYPKGLTSIDPNYQYFYIDKQPEALWQAVVQCQQIMVYTGHVPDVLDVCIWAV